MTDRGLPIVDGAPACPFVAFEDDRDARATGPDHRHRCFAEVRPAPRALAHQEAYCLSSAFPVCPTFQDWARREAAQARADEASRLPDDDVASGPGRPPGGVTDPGGSSSVHRNPHRDWAAPPPWVGGPRDVDGDEEAEVRAQPPMRGGGLTGSFADRLTSETAGRHPAAPGPDRRLDGEDEVHDDAAAGERRPARGDRPAPPVRAPGPAWERPRRMEAYPTLKTRLGLPSISLPPIMVGVAAVVIAAIALFFLPALLGVGNPPGPAASPTPTVAAPSESRATPAPPTAVPGPTPQIYLVQAGDTMSKIAARFGLPLQVLVDANAETIPDPDVLEIGQEVIIPNVSSTPVPDAGGVTEAPSVAP